MGFADDRLSLALDMLDALPLETCPVLTKARALVGLAVHRQLQACDLVYFALAQALRLPIAALDGGPGSAAVVAGAGLIAVKPAERMGVGIGAANKAADLEGCEPPCRQLLGYGRLA